jgi:hypothetical protein
MVVNVYVNIKKSVIGDVAQIFTQVKVSLSKHEASTHASLIKSATHLLH